MQTSVHSSALFLTAAAQNLLCMKLASELGVLVVSPWVTWFKAAIVPAAVGIIVTPYLMYKVSPLFSRNLGLETRSLDLCGGVVTGVLHPEGGGQKMQGPIYCQWLHIKIELVAP